jgi:hypothetical protein
MSKHNGLTDFVGAAFIGWELMQGNFLAAFLLLCLVVGLSNWALGVGLLLAGFALWAMWRIVWAVGKALHKEFMWSAHKNEIARRRALGYHTASCRESR